MPKNPIDYSKSVIYTIIHINDTSLNYVGSTTDFTKRKYHHKQYCKLSQIKLYVMIRDNGNWDMFVMKPYKIFPCQSSIELHIEEERCRLELNATLNIRRCHITEEQHKDYYEKNKVEIREQQKEHYEKNKIEIIEKQKEHYEKNKIEILEKSKNKHICECGGKYTYSNKSNHEQTKKHINLIKNN